MLPGIRAELDALRRRHSAALELMGERDEEVYIFVFLFALKSIIELSLCNTRVTDCDAIFLVLLSYLTSCKSHIKVKK